MPKYNVLLFMLACLLFLGKAHAQSECGIEYKASEKNYEAAHNFQWTKLLTNHEFEVPVIFHILYDDEHELGEESNLSDEVILNQLEMLNTAFDFVSDEFSLDVDFCPAIYDYNGRGLSTPGINRVSTRYLDDYPAGLSYDLYDVFRLSGCRKYDPSTALNIIVYRNCNRVPPCGNLGFSDCSGNLANATFPESDLPGLIDLPADLVGNDDVHDQIFIPSQLIPGHAESWSDQCPNFLVEADGSTLVHEVGHYLGLLHTWSDDCSLDNDFCDDTPIHTAPSYCTDNGCDPLAAAPLNNYMNYGYGCRNEFTPEQLMRVAYVLQNSPRRAELTTSEVCSPADFCSATEIPAIENISAYTSYNRYNERCT